MNGRPITVCGTRFVQMSFNDLQALIVMIANVLSDAIHEIAAVFEGEGGYLLMLVILLVIWYALAG